MIARILLLISISWVMGLTTNLFSLGGHEFSGRDLILISGGLFLLWKSTHEIHHSLEGALDQDKEPEKASFSGVLIQIAVIDIVFSLDSVITAVGMAKHLQVMVLAVVIAVGIMMVGAKPIGDFVEEHPTFKILALSFLLMVGVSLIGEGLEFHIPKGYIYFAMAFSASVEFLNLKMRKSNMALQLRKRITG
jgi:predicted tellurium resistance membrane protein TerC